MPLLESGLLSEIIFVNDGSTDNTQEIVESFPVQCIRGEGRGPGAARNLGWRAAKSELIWFIDSDCVAEPGALEHLLPHMEDPKVGGAGGSYGNMRPDSLLACLIHEEILARHRTMPSRVNFLATFNVVYRRSILEQIGGFDERFLLGQDAELAWRVIAAGYELGFELQSRVKHFHPAKWRSYLRTQRRQGFFRVKLYSVHSQYARGDAYSGFVDHVQPPLAMLMLAALPTLFFGAVRWVMPILIVLLLLLQLPMTLRLVRATGQLRYTAFIVMGAVRSFARGIGLTAGVLSTLGSKTAATGASASKSSEGGDAR